MRKLKVVPAPRAWQARCQRTKEKAGGDGGEVGRCETDQTMDVRKALLLQAREKRSGGGAEEWRRACDNLKLLKSLVFCNSRFCFFQESFQC